MSLTFLYAGEHRGDFVNWVTRHSHKPYETWTQYSNKAKYWRLLLVQIYNTHKRLEERLKIARVVEQYNWDIKEISNIKSDLKAKKISYTQKELENIIASGKLPDFPTSMSAVMDFSQTDNQVFKKKSETDTELKYQVQLDGKEWWDFTITKPGHLLPNITKFNKPKIQKLKAGRIVIVSPYEVEPQLETVIPVSFKTKPGVMGEFGCDLGKLKAFAGAITFSDSSYTTELTMSKETEKLNKRLLLINKELDFINKKMKTIEELLRGRDNSYLSGHWEDLQEQAKLIVSKRTGLKEHLGWLVARDVANHCLAHNVKLVKLENLKFVTNKGGKWDYATVQDKILQKAELNGIRTMFVDAWMTSQTDPFSGAHVKPKNNRTLNLSDGSEWDRDYTAALECSRRCEVKRGKKTKRPQKVRKKILIKSKSRDKLAPTPKRPRRLSNRGKRLLLKKKVAWYPASLNRVTGESVIVASSGVVARG